MNILKIILLILAYSMNNLIAAIEDDFLNDLPIINTIMGNRRTNVGYHNTLYPGLYNGLVINCHPYNPTDVLGDPAPLYASHPLIIRYNPILHHEELQDVLPNFIRIRLEALGQASQLFLNVQDNPWNGTPILLRPHAFSDFFPGMGGNYQGVLAQVYHDNGGLLLDSISSVHLHDGVASPNNFHIAELDHAINQAFYSVVTYGGRSVITRHILLTVPNRVRFQNYLCDPEVERTPAFFTPLLSDNYGHFVEHYQQ